MAGKKVGSDGQIRKTTAEWAADTATYPEGMRLMNTDTGAVRVSKGTTYALAWQAASGGAATWGTITGTLSDQTDLQQILETQANAIGSVSDSMPKRYKWIGDGGAATGTVIANTLGVTINVTNPSTGTYVFTAASGTPFTTNKTTIYVQSVDGGTAYITGADNPSSSTSIQEVHTYDIAGALDNSPRYQVIIEVEP